MSQTEGRKGWGHSTPSFLMPRTTTGYLPSRSITALRPVPGRDRETEGTAISAGSDNYSAYATDFVAGASSSWRYENMMNDDNRDTITTASNAGGLVGITVGNLTARSTAPFISLPNSEMLSCRLCCRDVPITAAMTINARRRPYDSSFERQCCQTISALFDDWNG